MTEAHLNITKDFWQFEQKKDRSVGWPFCIKWDKKGWILAPLEDKDSEISATEGNVLISNFYNFPRLELTPRLWLPLLILLYLSPPSTILTALFLWRHWIIIASLSAVIKRLRKSSLLLFQCKSYMWHNYVNLQADCNVTIAE